MLLKAFSRSNLLCKYFCIYLILEKSDFFKCVITLLLPWFLCSLFSCPAPASWVLRFDPPHMGSSGVLGSFSLGWGVVPWELTLGLLSAGQVLHGRVSASPCSSAWPPFKLSFSSRSCKVAWQALLPLNFLWWSQNKSQKCKRENLPRCCCYSVLLPVISFILQANFMTIA